MEDILENKFTELINMLSRKKNIYIELKGKCNSQGELREKINNPISLPDRFDYFISLLTLETSSFFPNITELNNKIYYTDDKNTEHKMELSTGAFEVDDIGKIIKKKLSNDNIDIILNNASGRTIMILKNNYKIDFTKPQTFHKLLGFKKQVYTKEFNESENIADVVSTQKVYVSCNLARGCYYEGEESQIIYSFPNQYVYGQLVSIKVKELRKFQMVNNNITEVILTFKDEKGNPVDFQGSAITALLNIQQI